MPVSVSLVASPLQLSTTQFTVAPKSPFVLPERVKLVSKATSSSGSSIVSTALGGRSAVSQMNEDLLKVQAQNAAALQARGNTNSTGVTGADLIQQQADSMELLKLQIAMQRESQYFTMMSNILKTRHETLKTIIGNIR